MANLPLAFGELLAGSVLAIAGVTGSSPADVINGRVTWPPEGLSGSSSGSGSAGSAGSAPASLSVQQAAQKWGVPVGILTGVYGAETNYGRGIDTSSAGAKGAFQFIQETAAQYHYPYVNSNDPAVIGQQTDAAAHYLHDLFQQTGNWDTALQRYSGGAYGLSHVQSLAQGQPTS